jgi:hypothetical protein
VSVTSKPATVVDTRERVPRVPCHPTTGGSLRADARPLVDSSGWSASLRAAQSPWTGRAVGGPYLEGSGVTHRHDAVARRVTDAGRCIRLALHYAAYNSLILDARRKAAELPGRTRSRR